MAENDPKGTSNPAGAGSGVEQQPTNLVIVGHATDGRYLNAVIARANRGEKEIVISARGRNIPRAIKILEAFRGSNQKVKDVSLSCGTKLATVTQEKKGLWVGDDSKQVPVSVPWLLVVVRMI